MTDKAVMAVDVGTGSARVGLFDRKGALLARAERPILMNQPAPSHAEHDSDDIWQAVCDAAKEALVRASLAPEVVVGISFDATCSLVALDADDRPVSVSTTGEDRWNTIVWMDHRAIAEAEECTSSRHKVLASVGNTMSPEMEIPKLMWLKRHLPEHWQRYARLLDLADFLTFRASGSNHRSCCTLTCKWTYLAHEQPGWQVDFLHQMGLDDLLERGNLPLVATDIGAPLGKLTKEAAADLGLTTACEVGTGLIDAHAGALAVLGPHLNDGSPTTDADGTSGRIGLIAGTSTCHMALSSSPREVPGVWGPYYGAVAPGLWLNEGGQSASGALLDHILAWHAKGRDLGEDAHGNILKEIEKRRVKENFAERFHVLPDFHGNRSPLADPHAVGVISGLTLDSSIDSLAVLYFRTAVAIALGTRHILDALNAKGYAIDHMHIAGGHTKNQLLMELYADTTGCKLVTPAEDDAVLLGTAIVAATAAGLYPDLGSAAKAMAKAGDIIEPALERRPDYDRDYRIFLKMHDQRGALDRLT